MADISKGQKSPKKHEIKKSSLMFPVALAYPQVPQCAPIMHHEWTGHCQISFYADQAYHARHKVVGPQFRDV